jgi:nucleotide-binding universal stress UspA family protein
MIRSIVVGTDGSDTATKAVQEAGAIAAKLGATVHLVSAYTRDQEVSGGRPPKDVEHVAEPRNHAEGILDPVRESLSEAGVKDINVHALEGDPAEAIIDIAEQTGADLIVVGNKGMTGAKRFLLGSVPNQISHHAPCSVLIVRTT